MPPNRDLFFRIPLQQWESVAIFIFAACSNVSFAKVLHDYAVAKNRFALTGAPLIVDRNMIFYCSFVLSLPIWWCCLASRMCCVLVFGQCWKPYAKSTSIAYCWWTWRYLNFWKSTLDLPAHPGCFFAPHPQGWHSNFSSYRGSLPKPSLAPSFGQPLRRLPHILRHEITEAHRWRYFQNIALGSPQGTFGKGNPKVLVKI